MSTIALQAPAPRVAVRSATARDNATLLALARGCVMKGDLSMYVDRAPDFFALNRLEGEAWRVGVALDALDAPDEVTGCIALARRTVWMNGAPRDVAYVSDLKVRPDARGSGAADALTWFVVDALRAFDESLPVFSTVLAGNAAMEHRMRGPRRLPACKRVGTIAVHSIPLLWRRTDTVGGLDVREARDEDLPAMVELWNRVMRRRQFAAVLHPETFAQWLRGAPGLGIEHYSLAHDAAGRLRGFVGGWDQSAFKRLVVVGYTARLAVVRRAFNLAAPLTGARRLPRVNEPLPVVALVHACADDAAALRALLLANQRRHYGRFAFMSLPLDVRDPLVAACRGLFAQPTLVNAYAGCARGEDIQLREAPLHFESALV